MSAKENLANVVSSLYAEGKLSEDALMSWSRLMEQMTEEGLLPLFDGEEGMYFQLICVE